MNLNHFIYLLKRICLLLILVSSCGCLGCDSDPPSAKSKVTVDQWYMVKLTGKHIGSRHKTRQKIEEDGQELWKTSIVSNMRVHRQGATVKMQDMTDIFEDLEGNFIRLENRTHGKNFSIQTTVKLSGSIFNIYSGQIQEPIKQIAWQEDTLIPETSNFESKLKQQGLQPGNSWTWNVYQVHTNTIVKEDWVVKNYEEVEMPHGKERLLLIQSTAVSPQGKRTVNKYWLNKNQEVAAFFAPGAAFYLTNKAIAVNINKNTKIDAITEFSLPLDPPLKNGHRTRTATYHIKFKGDLDTINMPPSGFTQAAKKIGPNTIEVKVRAATANSESNSTFTSSTKPTDNDRKASQLIQCDDPKVTALAKQISSKPARSGEDCKRDW